MGRTILCPHCKSTFDEDILKQRNSETVCLVCGKSLLSEGETVSPPEKKETKKYNYYKEGGGTLIPESNTALNKYTPLYTFDATDIEDAERQLKEVMPNCPLLKPRPSDKVSCPYCGSTEIQIVQKKYSLFTGFATNDIDRVCVRCKRKF